MTPQERLVLIAKSIEIRDNAESMTQGAIYKAVQELGEFKFWSYRQLAAICRNQISHSKVAHLVSKTDKKGGKFNPDHLEMLRDIVFQRSAGKVDWERIRTVMDGGTSGDMIARVTGMPKSSIYRKFRIDNVLQKSLV